MGNIHDQPLPDLPSNDYLMISFCDSDSLVVLYAGDDELNAIREAITIYWKFGIYSEKIKYTFNSERDGIYNCYQFALKGTPFAKSGERHDSISIRLMVTKILQSFHLLSWKLLVSTDLSRVFDKTSLIFERRDPNDEVTQPRFFNIGLSSTDTLQLNNCSNDLVRIIRQTCAEIWTDKIKKETRIDEKSFEIQLCGNPWNTSKLEQAKRTRNLLKQIIEQLAKKKFILYANCNLKDTADTLFFQHMRELPDLQEYAIVSLNKGHYLQLYGVCMDIFLAVKGIVQQYWLPLSSSGVRLNPKYNSTCAELTLDGNPWSCGGEDSINARFLIVKILECMSSFGYFIQTGLDLSRTNADKAVLLFRKGLPKEEKYFCLSPLEIRELAVINVPTKVYEATKRIVCQPCFNAKSEERFGENYQISFHWDPWHHVNGGQGVFGRFLLLNLLIEYKKLGYRLAASFDIAARFYTDNLTKHTTDVNSWFFVYDETLIDINDINDNDINDTTTIPSAPALSGDVFDEASPPPYLSCIPETPPPSYNECVQSL